MNEPVLASSGSRVAIPETALGGWRSDLARLLWLAAGLVLGLFVVARPVPSHLAPYSVEAAFAGLLALLYVLLAWGAGTARPERQRALPETVPAALLLWLGLVLLGLLRSPNAGAGLPKAADAAVYALLLLSSFAWISLKPWVVLPLARAVVALGAAEACVGLWLKWVQLPRLRVLVEAHELAPGGTLQSQQGKDRLYSEEIFGTFDNANSFASFLLLALCVLAGLWLQARARRAPGAGRWRPQDGLYAAVFVLLALAFYYSGSKGAWVACGFGAWFLAAQAASSTPGRARILKALTWLGVLGLLALLVLGTAGVSLPGLGESMQVRFEYWRTAWRMLSSEPVLGIGLGGFGDAFLFFKTPLAREVKEAHNDWLQLWAELGIVGPLAWGLLWYVILRPRADPAHPAPEGISAAGEPRSGEWFLLAGALLSFVLLYIFLDSMAAYDLAALLFAAVYLATRQPKSEGQASSLVKRRQAEARTSGTPVPHAGVPEQAFAWGLRAALGAVLVHQCVDFDLQVPGVMAFCFLLGGMLLALGAPARGAGPAARPGLLSRALRWAVPAAALLLATPAVLVPLFSGQARQLAADLEEGGEEAGHAAGDAATTPSAEDSVGAPARLRKSAARAVQFREEALRWAPFDGQAAFDAARAYIALRQMGVRRGSRDGPTTPRSLEDLIDTRLEEAARLRPYWPGGPLMRGHVALHAAREPSASDAEQALRMAEAQYREAARRYPLAPAFRVLVGDARLRQGRMEEAAKAYVKAWEIDRSISDFNTCFAALFFDPQPGCLSQLGATAELVPLFQRGLDRSGLSPTARQGLLVRRLLGAAWLRKEALRRVSAAEAARAAAVVGREEAEAVRAKLEVARALADTGLRSACLDLLRVLPEDGHAALFYAAALRVTSAGALNEETRQAWEAAQDVERHSQERKRPGTPPSVVGELRWRIGLP